MEKNKIQLYEYIDIIDPSSKLQQIEKRGEKEDKYSWEIFVEEIREKVIHNEYIEDFINKVNENIKFSKIYYISNNIHIDRLMEMKNKENQEYFYDLQKKILLISLNKMDFYCIQKEKIYQEMEFIKKIYIKLKHDEKSNNIKILMKMLNQKFEKLEKRINLLRLFYNNIKYRFYENDIIINIKNVEDINLALDFIKSNKKVYYNVKLPNIIKIKESNNNPPVKINEKIDSKDYYNICNYILKQKNKTIDNYNLKGNIHKTKDLYLFFKNYFNSKEFTKMKNISNTKDYYKYRYNIYHCIAQATDIKNKIENYKYIYVETYFDLFRKRKKYIFDIILKLFYIW